MQISSDTYFTYDGHQSYLYGLRFAWIEDSPEKVMVSEKKYSQIKNNTQNYFRVAKSEYDDPLEFDAMMSSDRVLFDAEVRRIYNKFFDKNQYKVLSLPVNGENIFFNCILTNVEKVEGGYKDKFGVVGFRLKIKCDAPWGWTEKKTVTPVIDASGRFIIRNRTDGQDYIYPEVIVAVPSAEDASESTKINNRYSCLGCPLIDVCLSENGGDLPSYMTTEQAASYSYTGNLIKRAMIINTSDDELRGTCIFCKPGEEQIIDMEPKTGIIRGISGDLEAYQRMDIYDNNPSQDAEHAKTLTVGQQLNVSLDEMLEPGVTHHIHIDSIKLTQKGAADDDGKVTFNFRRSTTNTGQKVQILNRGTTVNESAGPFDFDVELTEECGKITIYPTAYGNAKSAGYEVVITGLVITKNVSEPKDDPEKRAANSGEPYTNAIARTNKKFIRLVPGDNVFYTENIASGDLTLRFEEARILV